MSHTNRVQRAIAAMVIAAGLATAQNTARPTGSEPAGSMPGANPGYAPQVPNSASGQTPQTNSSYQTGRNGHLSMGIGWLGLAGLAGLFGLRRNPD